MMAALIATEKLEPTRVVFMSVWK